MCTENSSNLHHQDLTLYNTFFKSKCITQSFLLIPHQGLDDLWDLVAQGHRSGHQYHACQAALRLLSLPSPHASCTSMNLLLVLGCLDILSLQFDPLESNGIYKCLSAVK